MPKPRAAATDYSQPVYKSAPSAPPGPPVKLRANHPDRYTVVRGDTLWDISSRFLEDPWLWPEIWQVNPQINNPHLIYPGDVISLIYVDGRPQLRVERGAPAGLRTERLSPQIRSESLEQAIETIPFDLIAPFISRPSVLEKGEAKKLPYVLSTKGHLIAGTDYDVYARGADFPVGSRYSIIHVGEKIRDPEDGDVLGYVGIYAGEGRVVRSGDPATVYLRDAEREVLEGDRLVQVDARPRMDFIPRAPSQNIDGQIMTVMGGVSLIGQYHIVAINRGQRHGVEPGHVLAIYQAGEKVRDPYKAGVLSGVLGSRVRLPDEPAGELMVFKTYDRMSYALVMEASSEIRVGDSLRNPE
ncbi:MAG: LysM peptidoglycan-binding domain-containing protein [Gammaproteobacteria bacterium]|nr:LysM peptidoglycan-binding domain-containing protein [Gammaproteobacteria bacterium]